LNENAILEFSQYGIRMVYLMEGLEAV